MSVRIDSESDRSLRREDFTLDPIVGHTPGPWRIGSGGWAASGGMSGGHIEAARPSGLFKKNADGSFTETLRPAERLATWIEIGSCRGEGRANARLMAAAPDLLEAAIRARSVLVTASAEITDQLGHEVIARRLAELDAAIAKASGSAP